MTLRKLKSLSRWLLIVLTICCAAAVAIPARAAESLRLRTTSEQESSETGEDCEESALPAASSRRVPQHVDGQKSSRRGSPLSSQQTGHSTRLGELRATRERSQSNEQAGRNGCGAPLRC